MKNYILLFLILLFACEQSMEIKAENELPSPGHNQDITKGLKVADNDGNNLTAQAPILENYETLNSVHLFIGYNRIQVLLRDLIGSDESNVYDYGDFGKPIFSDREMIDFTNFRQYEFEWGNEGALDIPDSDEDEKMFIKIENSQHYEDAYEELPHSVNEYIENIIKITNIEDNEKYNFDSDLEIELNKNLTLANSHIQMSFSVILDQFVTLNGEQIDRGIANHVFLIPTEERSSYKLSKETMKELVKLAIDRMKDWLSRNTGVTYDFKEVTVEYINVYASFNDLEYDKINVTRTTDNKNYDLPIYIFESDGRKLETDNIVINVED